jgi:hypothetical protein
MPDHAAMRATALLIPLAAVISSTASAADIYGGTPMLGQVGGTYLSSELREPLVTDWGFYAGLATLLGERGAVGMPSLDLDGRYATGTGGELITFESCYSERALVGQRWWLGAGFGANWMSLKLKGLPGKADDRDEQKWGIGGKGMLGMLISNRLFVEGTYHYTPKILETATTTISVGLGYWF